VAHFEAYFAVHVVNFPSTHSVLFFVKVKAHYRKVLLT